MKIKIDLLNNLPALVEAALYDSWMQEFGASTTRKLKEETKLTNKNSVLEVNSFLASALLMGHEPYSLKEGLLNSNKAKTAKQGNRYLTVPVGQNSFATVTSKSEGWIHPGFEEKDWLPLFHFILSERLLELMIS